MKITKIQIFLVAIFSISLQVVLSGPVPSPDEYTYDDDYNYYDDDYYQPEAEPEPEPVPEVLPEVIGHEHHEGHDMTQHEGHDMSQHEDHDMSQHEDHDMSQHEGHDMTQHEGHDMDHHEGHHEPVEVIKADISQEKKKLQMPLPAEDLVQTMEQIPEEHVEEEAPPAEIPDIAQEVDAAQALTNSIDQLAEEESIKHDSSESQESQESALEVDPAMVQDDETSMEAEKTNPDILVAPLPDQDVIYEATENNLELSTEDSDIDLEAEDVDILSTEESIELTTLTPTSAPTATFITNTHLEPIKFTDDRHFGTSCSQPPVTGMCRGAFPMFYFDPETRTCKQFVYGGCRGNENVHKSASDCYNRCYPEGLKKNGTEVVSTRGSRNNYLTVRGGTGASVLTFTGSDASAKVDPAVLVDFTIADVYAFEFDFRTDSPHGLIAYLRQMSTMTDVENTRIQLYIYLKKGHLAVTHVQGTSTETFVMRRGGLQARNWHAASVQINSGTGELSMDVDGSQEFFEIQSLVSGPRYTGARPSGELASVLWVGGVSESETRNEDMLLGLVPFHGCMRHLSLSSGESRDKMVPVRPLVATKHTGVTEKCVNNCRDRYTNLCSRKSHCIEHFDHSSCACFGTGKDGPRCTNPAIPVLSLNGDGYVVHRLYEWMDRVHSYTNFISVGFKTRFTDSILFYASAEYPERQYIAASLTPTGSIYVEVNFGEGARSAEFGKNMNSEVWHTLSVIHQNEKISLYIDSQLYETIIVPGKIHYFHLDPDFYLGNAPALSRACGLPLSKGSSELEDQVCTSGGDRYHYDASMGLCQRFNYTGCGGNANNFPDLKSCMESCYVPGLRSLNTFMGCMHNVFFNDVSILQSLREEKKETRYYGSTKKPALDTKCKDTKFLSVTFSTERAAMNLINPEPQDFHLAISFRPSKSKGVIASGIVGLAQYETISQWELRHDENHVYFYIHENLLNIKSEAKIKLEVWNYVDIQYKSGRVNMMVNNKNQGKAGPGKLNFSPKITIGKNILEEFPGFIGCIRKLYVGRTRLDLRTVVGTPMVNKDVTYDNCQVLGPCEGPRACEHGGKCSIDEDGEVQCDCTGTGYTGRSCHFSLYKKSCEQYRQIGLSDGVFRVDIDGNGPLKPAYVKCSYNELIGETYTTLEHNIDEEYEVRKAGIDSFELDVKYRGFCSCRIKELIRRSKYCSQEIEYSCRRAPLRLSKETWFKSPAKKFMSNFASRKPGICRCKELNSCEDPDVTCNCDINDGILRKDKGVITDPEQLPVTAMYFLKGEDQQEDSEAHMTLGPLVCAAEAVKEHSVSFTTPSSYLEVPAWREGSLFLTFKTTIDKAIIAYQPAYHPRHATFMVSLIGPRELEFMYRYQGEVHHQVLHSRNPLNNGEWQQVLVDVYDQQLRFVINSEEKIIDVDPNAYLGVLDGSMFLGGIPEQFQAVEGRELESLKLNGLVGCIRSLTLNDEVVDMEKLFRASSKGVSLGCTPSCKPNPCKNGAQCVELWGTYQCQCANPIAQSGKNCENNINEDAITFTTKESKYKYFDNDTIHSGERILNETFYLNFRTHAESGLILFAYNHLHNFVQLHLASKNEVVFLFNHGTEVMKTSILAPEGVVFSNGQPVQVKIERLEDSTSLLVFTEGVYLRETLEVGVLLLGEDEYEQFPFGDSQPLPEMVYYPHSMTIPRPFYLAYLGSANDKQHDIRSEVPGFMGCFRGFKIGDNEISLTKLLAQSPYPSAGVEPDCKMACDHNPCLNGGKCTEDFQFFNNFHCDCSETSYTGATCNSEVGYTFSGNQWIAQHSTSSPLDGDLRFELSFSASIHYLERQVIALMRSTNPSSLHDYLLLWADPDGSMTIEAQISAMDQDQVHGVKVTPADNFHVFDGSRHYVIIEKKDDHWTVKVDDNDREIQPLRNVYISETQLKNTPTSLYLGGIETGLDERMAQLHSFHGCISNVLVKTDDGTSYPLRQYSEGDLHFSKHGIPGQGRCAGFGKASGSYPLLMARMNAMNVSSVMGPEWVYNRPEKKPYAAPLIRSAPVRDTAFDNVVPTVAGSVLAISLVIVVILLLRLYLKKREEKASSVKVEEKKLLANGGNLRGPFNDMRTTTMKIVSSEEMVPLKSAPDGVIQSSTIPVTETIQQEKPSITNETPETEVTDDVPEVPCPEEDKPCATGTEEAQIHSDAAGEPEEVKVRSTRNSEDGGEVAGRPLSWDKSTDNLPLIIGQEPVGGGDSSSESSIDCTLDINATPPPSPPPSPTSTSKPITNESVDDTGAPPLPAAPPPETKEADLQGEADSDAEPVLQKVTPLPEATSEFLPTGDEASNEQKTEEKEVNIDFSKVPVIKIERSQSEDEEIVVDDDIKGEEADPTTTDVTEDNAAEGEQKAPEKSTEPGEDFIEYRDDSVKVEDAERMSKVESEPSVDCSASVDSVSLEAQEPTENSSSKPEVRVDLQRYYLTKKPSIPPALPPREKKN